MNINQEIESIKNEMQKLQERIDNLETKKDDNELKLGQYYYYINSLGDVNSFTWFDSQSDNYQLNKNNIWLNREDCERYNEIDKKYRQLVYDLNKENPIDWNDFRQVKYCLTYDFKDNETIQCCNIYQFYQSVYCSNSNLFIKALNLIGRENLKWYIKNYRA